MDPARFALVGVFIACNAVVLAGPEIGMPPAAVRVAELPRSPLGLYQKEFEPAPEAAGMAQTLQQFASAFVPVEGKYEAVFLHPSTRQPVRVWFTLPRGPWQVFATSKAVVFLSPRFGRVQLYFKGNGRVVVERTSGGPFYN